ncbi:hypothetical protein N7474_008868 [Penicillium riverlandense]|uniref:uncharacterized protein n=1 Tax=Penicillium riverlandense TaxID=1903569 RepID=UPI002546E13A|nr:uncharacterized protein N7474_008868 [Penicillium riverlandense]KAJ5812567.1 hypothetical protein N7474_008868 [Penicillium riverlandense]
MASRNRKLVTYGATRSRPSNDAPGGTSPSQRMLQDPLPSARTKKSGSIQSGTRRPTTPTRTTDSAPSVFDLPSSEDEGQTDIFRRKRRRQAPDEKDPRAVVQTHDGPKTTTSATTKKGAGSSPRIRGTMRDSRWMSSQASKPAVTVQSTTPSAGPETPKRRQRRSELPAPDERHASNEQSFSKSAVTDLERPLSSSSSHDSYPTIANTTPGRRRLIDSLGIQNQPSEESPVASPASSQPAPRVSLGIPFQTTESSRPNLDGPPENPGHDSPSALASHLWGSKVTYARQRSFLDDLSLAGELSAQDISGGLEQRHRSSSPRAIPGNRSRARLFALEEENHDEGTVRSIHELRQAGGNARFRGAVESIFEDIEDDHNSTSGRCNAFMQLCSKLLDSKLRAQFVECDFGKRLVNCILDNLDIVSATFALCAYGLGSLGGGPRYLLAREAWPKLLAVSPMLLNTYDDVLVVAQNRANGLSKPVQKAVQSIIPQVISTLFPEIPPSKVSPSLVALYCLKLTASTVLAKGENGSGIRPPMLKQLIDVLSSQSSPRGAQGTLPPEDSQILSLVFSILEAHTASAESSTEGSQSLLSRLSGLHGLLRSVDDSDLDRQQMQTLYMRVILNVTNGNSALCDDFATTEMVGGLVHIVLAKFGDLTEDSLAQENNSLDRVILALGTLINLTEQSEAARGHFFNPACGPKSFLNRLLRLFLTHVDSVSNAHSVVEVHHNVAVGYLAVLLLTLCLNPEARSRIKEKDLTRIKSTVDEFLQYHQKIESREAASGFLVRLQALVGQIQQMEEIG